MADSCMYTSKPLQQVSSDVQVATQSCVPTPIVLEISDDEDKQLAAKVKQQQAELKKATHVLEHVWESKRKAAEEAVECEHEKKAAHEMDEMAHLERMWEQHEHDVCCGPCMLVGRSLLIVSATDDAQGTQKCKAVVDMSSINHECSTFGQGTKSCLTCLEHNLLCTWNNWALGHKYTQCNACHQNTLQKKCR